MKAKPYLYVTMAFVVLIFIYAIFFVRMGIERERQKSRISMYTRNDIRNIGAIIPEYRENTSIQLQPSNYPCSTSPHLGVSWRVMLLPYLDNKYAYEYYNKNEPWNSDHNIFLEHKAGSRYIIVSDGPQAERCHTRLVAIIPSSGHWLPEQGAYDELFNYSEENTSTENDDEAQDRYRAIILETGNSNIHWMEPRDYPSAWVSPHINSGLPYSIEINSSLGASALMSDGSVRTISKHTSPQVVKALLGE